MLKKYLVTNFWCLHVLDKKTKTYVAKPFPPPPSSAVHPTHWYGNQKIKIDYWIDKNDAAKTYLFYLSAVLCRLITKKIEDKNPIPVAQKLPYIEFFQTTLIV